MSFHFVGPWITIATMIRYVKSLLRPDPVSVFIRKHVCPGHCAIDVGANIGTVSRALLKQVGPTGQVHAFEPNMDLINSSLARITQSNFHVHTQALSSTVGEATFFIDCREDLPAVASSIQVLDDLHALGKVKAVAVATTTLDTFVRESKTTPDFIKIDVEGHELSVFQGAIATISTFRPIIVFEFWETWWTKGIQNIFAFLSPHYKLIRVHDGNDAVDYYSRTSATGVVDIACLPVSSTGSFDASLLSTQHSSQSIPPAKAGDYNLRRSPCPSQRAWYENSRIAPGFSRVRDLRPEASVLFPSLSVLR
jgi:FkbM family methyltransferase